MATIVRHWQASDRPAVLALNVGPQERERRPSGSRRPEPGVAAAYVAVLEAALADGEDGALFVAEAAELGPVIGFLACFVGEDTLKADPRELTIHDLVVTAAARRRGAARQLLAAARGFAAERGIRRVMVPMRAANALSAAAHRALGFRPLSLTLELEAMAP